MNQKEHLGVGWNFPVKLVNGRLEWARYEDRVQQSIAIILLTAQRERPMLNSFGAASRDFVFEPNSPRTHRSLESAVQKALLEWEPRINVERVEATPDPDQPNLVRVHIDYVVRATNTFYNKVFPFYLVEGNA
jgi:phage baseplate assembly protein W